jgi:hypothetical protein
MQIQQFLTIGALVIFTTFLVSFNRGLLSHSTISDYNEAVIVATSLAQSMIDEVYGRSFDESTISEAVASVDSLTSSNKLGCDVGEGSKKTPGYNFISTFDDIDDFNGLEKVYSDKKLGEFKAKVEVFYVDRPNTEIRINTQSFIKRVNVSIVNSYLVLEENYLKDTLKFSTIISY